MSTTTSMLLLSIQVKGKPISMNRMYKPSRWGGKYLSDEAKSWRDAVWAEAREKSANRIVSNPQYRPLRVVCTYYGVRANADADNLAKLTIDGLKYGLCIDDRHFNPVESRISRDRTQPQGACIEVYAATLEQGAA